MRFLDETDLLTQAAESHFVEKVSLVDIRQLVRRLGREESGILGRWERLALDGEDTANGAVGALDAASKLVGVIAGGVAAAAQDWTKCLPSWRGEREFTLVDRGQPAGERLLTALSELQHGLSGLLQPLQNLTDALSRLRPRGAQHRTVRR